MWEQSEGDVQDYYRMVPNPEDVSEGAVELIVGPFAGLVYKYGDFRFEKPEELDQKMKVEYQFEVLHIPEEIRDVDYPDAMKESFDQLLLNILVHMVQAEADKEVRNNHVNADGNVNIDEPLEERVIHEECSSVSEE
tara:strand:+ start:3278 stop:3688 length:411 start_codon:yes stop_codon:yes gene_type:complete